jgi:hypothetical protein
LINPNSTQKANKISLALGIVFSWERIHRDDDILLGLICTDVDEHIAQIYIGWNFWDSIGMGA